MIFSDSGVNLESNDVYNAALATKVNEVKSKMPATVLISNPKLVKVSTSESRRRRDDHSDAYQLIFDLFQEIVKAIATDKDFVAEDVAAEIAALRTAAVNAGATLPAQSATTITTESAVATTEAVTTTTQAVTTTAATTQPATTPKATTPAVTTPKVTTPATTTPKATTPAVTTPKATDPAVTTPKATTSKATTPKDNAPTVTTAAVDPPVTSGATISAETTKSNLEKSTPSQSPQISSGSFVTLAVSLLIGNLISRFIL